MNLIEELQQAVLRSRERFGDVPLSQKWTRLRAFIFGRLAGMLNRTFTVYARTFWGERMMVVLPELVSVGIFKTGFHEKTLTLMLLRLLRSGMVFFDVGAHFGYYTLLAAHLVGSTGQVHSFEPDQYSFRILKKNSDSSTRIFTNNLALFSKAGIIDFFNFGPVLSAFNTHYGVPRLFSEPFLSFSSSLHRVVAITLDEYTEGRQIHPDFIKIDAEGAGYEILNGAEKILTESRPVISLEVGDAVGTGIKSSKQCIDFLLKFEYLPYEYARGEIVPCRLKEEYMYDNILFLPKERVAEILKKTAS